MQSRSADRKSAVPTLSTLYTRKITGCARSGIRQTRQSRLPAESWIRFAATYKSRHVHRVDASPNNRLQEEQHHAGLLDQVLQRRGIGVLSKEGPRQRQHEQGQQGRNDGSALHREQRVRRVAAQRGGHVVLREHEVQLCCWGAHGKALLAEQAAVVCALAGPRHVHHEQVDNAQTEDGAESNRNALRTDVHTAFGPFRRAQRMPGMIVHGVGEGLDAQARRRQRTAKAFEEGPVGCDLVALLQCVLRLADLDLLQLARHFADIS